MRLRKLMIAGLLCAATLQLFLIASPEVSLGIPGEWEWRRHAFPATVWLAVLRFVPAAFGTIVLLSISMLGDARLRRQAVRGVAFESRSRRRAPSGVVTASLLMLLVFGSWFWLKTAERCAPVPHRNLKPLWILYDPASSGYFYEAAFRMDSTSRFLSSYSERIEGEVLHIGTHPPGLFLLSRWAIQLCEQVPWAAAGVRHSLFQSDVDSFRILESSSSLSRQERPLRDAELAALGLISEMTTLAAAATVVPLFFLVRRCFDLPVAWRIACLWATLPCLAVFLPKSDVLFSLTSMSAVSLGTVALATSYSVIHRLLSAVACGIILWCGLLLSLAHLPVLALLAALFTIRLLHRRSRMTDSSQQPASPMAMDTLMFATILVTIAAATAAFSVTAHCNLLSIWRTNLGNHGDFYEQHVRTVWKWLIVNPLELGMAVGLPVAVSAVAGAWIACRARPQGIDRECHDLRISVTAAIVVTFLALWLSGRNSGEAARLWCFLTPWLLVLPGHLLQIETSSKQGSPNRTVIWPVVLLLQMAVCVLTSGRVSGFSF